jgi:hypothetical protein
MKEAILAFVQAASDWAVPVLFLVIAAAAVIKKVKVYEEFIEGAKEGFNVGVRIIPYVVAILCAIAIFRASGALDALVAGLGGFLSPLGIPPKFSRWRLCARSQVQVHWVCFPKDSKPTAPIH